MLDRSVTEGEAMAELLDTSETLEGPRPRALSARAVVAVVVAIVIVAGAALFAQHRAEATPAVHLGTTRWTVGFDGGESASFQAPADMRRTACCSAYHVGLTGAGTNAPTLDAATDDSPNSEAENLHALAAQESTYDARYDGRSDAISYLTIAGNRVAQYTFTYRIHTAHPIREMATLMLVGHEELSFYWAQDKAHFSSSVARAAEDAVVRSLRLAPTQA